MYSLNIVINFSTEYTTGNRLKNSKQLLELMWEIIGPKCFSSALNIPYYYAPDQGALSDDARLTSVCRVHRA